MIYIVSAQQNVVSKRIGDLLEGLLEKQELSSNVIIVKPNTNVLDFPLPLGIKQGDRIIVPSTHKSATSKPCFTVHTPGNWNLNEMGGQEKTLCYADSFVLKHGLHFLNKYNELGWDVTLEVDHHGPTYDFPITFFEIGSSEEQWNNEQALQIMVKTITDVLRLEPKVVPSLFCVGGPHYAPKFTKLFLDNDDFYIGHILPGYQIDALDYETFVQGIEKVVGKTKEVLLDWKGMKGRQREKLIAFCEQYGLPWRK